MLRPYYKFDHRLYSKLCRCAYETFLEFFQLVFEGENVVPGVVLPIHTFGNLLNHHPHLHGLFNKKMKYLPEEGKVIYGKPKGEKKVFDAMDFLAHATSRIKKWAYYIRTCPFRSEPFRQEVGDKEGLQTGWNIIFLKN